MESTPRIPLDLNPTDFWKQWELGRAQVRLDLAVSQPSQAGIVWDESSLFEFIRQGKPWSMTSSQTNGHDITRQAVATYLQTKGVMSSATDVRIVASTSEAYSILFKAFTPEAESAGVLVPRPGYPLLDSLASLDGWQVLDYRYEPSGMEWRLKWEELEHAPSCARALVIVDPLNPLGICLSESDWRRFGALCVMKNWLLIIDEVFGDYVFKRASLVDFASLLPTGLEYVRLGGLSKSAGLPSVKLGWMTGFLGSWEKVEWVMDSYLSVGNLAEALAVGILPYLPKYQDRVRERLQVNLQKATSLIGDHRWCRPQGGWFLCIHMGHIDEEQLVLELQSKFGLRVSPGFLFDFEEEGWVVVSLLTEPTTFAEGLAKLLGSAEK